MSLTTNQILTLARKKILEYTTDVVDDTTLLIYANLTQEDIYKKAFPNSQILSTTISFTNGVGTLPSNFGTLYGDGFQTLGTYFPELSIEDFMKKTLDRAVTIEGGTIKVYPETTSSLTFRYYPTFPALTSAVNPTIDSYFHECITYGCVYRAFEDLQDQEMSEFFKNKYNSMLEEKINTQSSYEETNQRGGQLFTEQNLIQDDGISIST
jgi:hypothetical protein